jgi:hypothetical protein
MQNVKRKINKFQRLNVNIPASFTIVKDSQNVYHHYTSSNPIKYQSSNDGFTLIGSAQNVIFSNSLSGIPSFTNITLNTSNAFFIKGFIKDDRIYVGYTAYSGTSTKNVGSLPRGWYILQSRFVNGVHKYNEFDVINYLLFPLGSLDGDHSLNYNSKTGKYWLYGRIRRSPIEFSNYDWTNPPTPAPDFIEEVDPQTEYPINDPRRNQDPRTNTENNAISFSIDVWSDRRGIRMLVSNSITGPFSYPDSNGNPSGNDLTHPNVRGIDPLVLFPDYPTSSIKTDYYSGTPLDYKNFSFIFSNTYLKNQKNYSSLRRDRKTGDGPFHTQLLFSKNSLDYTLAKDDTLGYFTPIINTFAPELNREWLTPAPDTGPTLYTSPPSFLDDINQSDWINSYGGVVNTGQIYCQAVWEDVDGNIYLLVNDQRNQHYTSQSNYTESWYLTGVNGVVNLTGTKPNVDITGSITFRPEDIQNNYKWEHLSEFLSRCDSVDGTKYIFNDVNSNITVNGKTKSVKAHLADEVPDDKWPFYKWWKKAYNYEYNRIPSNLIHVFKQEKGRFASWVQNNTASPGIVTSKALSVNGATHVGLNINGSFEIRFKNGSTNAYIGTTTTLTNINAIEHKVALPSGLPSTIKVEVKILSGEFFGLELFTFIDPNVAFTITGGTETVVNGYKYHTFTGNGTLNVTASSPKSVEVLLVGGGGAGGGKLDLTLRGGGGGGGGVIQQTLNLTTNNYTIAVGNGGSGQNTNGIGNTGQNTTAFSLTALGGGGGGGNNLNGLDGGSGGGGLVGGQSLSSQGNNGGSNPLATAAGPGGGGAIEIGGTPIDATNVGGDGGEGLNIWGTVYGSGGGGASNDIAATAGLGGTNAGKGRGNGTGSTAGIVNTGGGGGGNRLANGSSGGSGIVIIRYLESGGTPVPENIEQAGGVWLSIDEDLWG